MRCKGQQSHQLCVVIWGPILQVNWGCLVICTTAGTSCGLSAITIKHRPHGQPMFMNFLIPAYLRTGSRALGRHCPSLPTSWSSCVLPDHCCLLLTHRCPSLSFVVFSLPPVPPPCTSPPAQPCLSLLAPYLFSLIPACFLLIVASSLPIHAADALLTIPPALVPASSPTCLCLPSSCPSVPAPCRSPPVPSAL